MGGITDMFGGGGDDAGDAAIEGSEIQAQAQREALDYLKETERIPQAYREQATTQLGSIYGLSGPDGGGGYDPGGKQAFVDSLAQDPFYQSLLDQGEQSVLRNASATGGLRSGTAQENLDINSQNVLRGVYGEQVQGLQGLAGQASYAPEIAGQMAGIGQTLGQGVIGSAQSQQAGQQQGAGNLMGIANLGLQAYGSGMFSDRRLKENLEPAGIRNGHKWHTWTWNKEAERLGFFGDSEGVIADEVAETHPEVIGNSSGYLTVNYQMLGVN